MPSAEGVSALFQGTPGLPTKAFYPQKWFLLLSARKALREWVSPAAFTGASQSGPREGQPQGCQRLTYLFASAHWVLRRQCSGSWEQRAGGRHLALT